MPPERRRLLDSIDFYNNDPVNIVQPLKKSNNQKWQDTFERLSDFYAMYNSSSVPFPWAKDPKLASWVQRQRAEYGSLVPSMDNEPHLEMALAVKYNYSTMEESHTGVPVHDRNVSDSLLEPSTIRLATHGPKVV